MDIAVLGPLELRAGAGQTVPVAGARLRTLLVLLALDANRVVSADRLIDGVWGADQPAAAGNALQALISRLRRAGLVIETAPAGYRLVIDPDRVDAHRFARLAKDPGAVTEALALWRGPLDFPPVARSAAVHLEELRLTAQQNRIAAELDDRTAAELIPELEGLVAAHPLHEPLTALLIRALLAADRPGRALAVFERIRAELADTLGADPSAQLTALHLEALRGREPAVRGNLPAEVSSFVGRDADIRAVRDLVRAHRLVTLTGPGGSGKTRLSVQVGHTLASTTADGERQVGHTLADTTADGERQVGHTLPGTTADGVWRVELAPITDPAEVPQAILSALRLRSQVLLNRPGRGTVSESIDPLTRLSDAVAGKDLLLVLDNCEHLIGTAAGVADTLLRAAPGLRLLATSREPLGITGEQIFPVEPLAQPPVGADAATASTFPAVRLLLDRATGFALDDRNVEPVVRIVRALDGMPLAIELAAARLRTLPVHVLADRLADRFRLLTGGSRTALPRHQTLRAMVDWSWDLLSEPERALWRRFAVFHGGAEVTAVEQVCDADIDLLAALVDKSLLVLGDNGRYRMLETIREYGLERLADAGETEKLRITLAGCLLDLAGEAEPKLRGADQLIWLRRLGEEHDNLNASLRAAIEAGDARTALAMTARLGWYWWLRGHRVEGAALATEVLAMPGAGDPVDLALTYTFHAINGLEGASAIEDVKTSFQAALALGHADAHPALRLLKPLAEMYDSRGGDAGFAATESLFDDPDPWLRAVSKMIVSQLRLNFGQSADVATREMRESLDGFREVGERWGTGFALSALGDMMASRGEFAQAVEFQREALTLVREVGVREDLPQLEVKLAHQLWMSGDHADARRMLKQARQTADEIGLAEVMVSVEYGYATIARAEGSLDEARERMDRTDELFNRSKLMPQFLATARSTRGLIEAAAGDLSKARQLHAEAIEVAVDTLDSPVIALVLVGVADLALRCGDPAQAARMLGAADAIRGSIDRAVPDVERIEAEARTALGDAGFSSAYASGESVTVATAIAAAGLRPGA